MKNQLAKINLSKLDYFYFLNFFIYLLLGLFLYYPRHIGKVHTEVMLIYFALFVVLAFSIWFFLARKIKLDFPLSSLVLLQIGILLHIVGGLKLFGDLRTYQLVIFDIGFDKHVHFINAFLGLIAGHIWFSKNKTYQTFFKNPKNKKFVFLFLVLVVVGIGALVEIIEYIGIRTLPDTTKWTYAISLNELYDNNLRDIIANFLGSVFAAVLLTFFEFKKKNASKK